MIDQKIKVALIGYGHIGKRHAAVIMDSDFFELTALVDPYQVTHPDNLPESVQLFPNLEALEASGCAAQLAVIATPNGLHHRQIEKCLDMGLDVVAEKPMVLSSQELLKLQQKAASKQLQLFPVVQNRYAKISRWLYDILQNNLLGKIYIIQINCLWNRDERYYQKESWHGDLKLDGGSLYTQFLHFMDMLMWLFGKPSVKNAALMDFNHQHLSDFEDSGCIQFDFAQGPAAQALSTMVFSTAAWGKNAESSLTILAEKGSVKIGGQYMETLIYANGSELSSEADLKKELSEDPYQQKYGAAGGHYRFWEELSNHYQGKFALLPTTKEAAAVIEIIEQIYQYR